MYELELRLRSRGGKTHEMLQALRSVMLPAQFEPGFESCQLYAEAGEVDSLFYREQWTAEEDLERSIRSPRFGRLLAVMETADGLPTLEVHVISAKRGWDYIRTLRGEGYLADSGNGN